MCAVNISKAFDAINHTLLLEQISALPLHHNLVRWLAAYIRGRTARCPYGSATSKPMILRSGVPQGSVLFPALFNFFLSDCPTMSDILSSYADDFTALESDADLEALSLKLQEAITPLLNG
jgi:hypothetical protein